jgi:hypothetical protein
VKTFRRTLAVLALACIAPLAQAFTLSVVPSSVQVGDAAVLQLDGSLTDVFALDVLVTFDAALVETSPDAANVDPASILDAGVAGAGGAFGFGGAVAGGSFFIQYIADPLDPLNVTDGRILSIPFLTNAAGIASFSIELCVMGANDSCARSPTSGGTVTPVTVGTRLTITSVPGRTPEPGSLLLLGAAVLGAAAVARTRRS